MFCTLPEKAVPVEAVEAVKKEENTTGEHFVDWVLYICPHCNATLS